MAGKLDQSLDEILSSRRKSAPRRSTRAPRGAAAAVRTTRAAASGGVQKKGRASGPSSTGKTNNIPIPQSGESKAIVSNLPSDVTEPQIKEYFGKTICPIKRVMLTYGPNGASRGIATIHFSRPSGASDALAKMNGMLVDSKPMKVEVVIDAKQAVQPKALGERLTGAKPRTSEKSTSRPTARGERPARGGATRGRGGRGGRQSRPKKTVDELDAEMADYFEPSNGNNENAPAVGGDAGMDEIS